MGSTPIARTINDMKPAKFKLHIHYLSERYKRVWAVETKGEYHKLTSVSVSVPMTTVFRGKNSPQPKAYLEGRGILTIKGRRGIIQ